VAGQIKPYGATEDGVADKSAENALTEPADEREGAADTPAEQPVQGTRVETVEEAQAAVPAPEAEMEAATDALDEAEAAMDALDKAEAVADTWVDQPLSETSAEPEENIPAAAPELGLEADPVPNGIVGASPANRSAEPTTSHELVWWVD
jgi:hypothetical protein